MWSLCFPCPIRAHARRWERFLRCCVKCLQRVNHRFELVPFGAVQESLSLHIEAAEELVRRHILSVANEQVDDTIQFSVRFLKPSVDAVIEVFEVITERPR